MFGVKIDNAGFDAKGEHPRRGFVAGVALAVGVATHAGNTTEEGDVRCRGAANEQHDGNRRADEHALEESGPEDTEQRGRGDEEFTTMHLPEPFEHLYFHETCHSHEDDGGEHRLRKIAQQVGEKKRDEQDDSGGDPTRRWGASAPPRFH